MTRLAWLALLVAVASCGDRTAAPRPQWTITVSTDAPVPQLGDRVLLEILDDAGNLACSGCRRETSAADANALPLSFGVESPADNSQLHVRIRLYRHIRVGSDGLPAGTALIDTLARLPPASSDIQISIPLLMDCFGVPSDPVQHLACDAQTRATGPEPLAAAGPPSVTASWPAAQAVDCAGAPPDGMLCVQAGLILMGSADTPYSDADYDPLPERLVRVSPFAIDAAELTVGQVRALLQAGTLDASHAPTPRATDLRQANGECTYLGTTDPTNDALPVNCLTLEDARAVCSALGNRLPTEAEWELVARNGAAERPIRGATTTPPARAPSWGAAGTRSRVSIQALRSAAR